MTTEKIVETCRHFTGLNNDDCRLGIKYKSLNFHALPCMFPEHKHTCQQWEPYTPDEIEERGRAILKAAEAFANFQSRKTDKCFHCGQTIISLKQIRRCVYAEPCGCRLWQGSVPEAWKVNS